MVLQYLKGNENHCRCVLGVLALCFNISQGKKIIIEAFRVTVLGWCFNISQGKKIIIDACMVYLHGASISHRIRRSF